MAKLREEKTPPVDFYSITTSCPNHRATPHQFPSLQSAVYCRRINFGAAHKYLHSGVVDGRGGEEGEDEEGEEEKEEGGRKRSRRWTKRRGERGGEGGKQPS